MLAHRSNSIRIFLYPFCLKCQAEVFGLDVSLEVLGTFGRIWPAEEYGGMVFGEGRFGRCVAHKEGADCDLAKKPPLGVLDWEGKKVEAARKCPSVGWHVACQVEGGTVWWCSVGVGRATGNSARGLVRQRRAGLLSIIPWARQHLI